ncbi:hypothetical protein SAMN05421823_11431 [Catalinimonas alkaloidigena]|uniref:Uncharacterized protein n=1 Tax=Catalinimonas alkaloidigena TaxID=1075417 RepID=A0A1G9TID2_9BACT|nr:hypothetical protein [Catalinimonas alkaloidigena]SDM47539.1 hypothetical protein SAMN05421823_11431 [Catalinimonas alkaloidigena]
MALTPKPKRKPDTPASKADEAEIERFIRQGSGTIAAPAEPQATAPAATPTEEEDPLRQVQLRLYQSLLDELDEHIRSLSVGRRQKRPSRHQWMVDAIEEKLERDSRKR